MSLARPQQNYQAVMIGLRGKYDLCKYIELWVTNENALDESFHGGHFPLLDTISGIGIQMNEFTPKLSSGTIRLINGRDSLAFKKRITDLGAQYAIQGAFCFIYESEQPITSEQIKDGSSLIWEGLIDDVSYSTGDRDKSELVSIGISRPQKEYLISKKITRKYSPLVPDRSLNKYLPMVFGRSVQVVPYATLGEQPGAIGENFFYAMCFRSFGAGGLKYFNRGITKILAPDFETIQGQKDTIYREVNSAPDYTVPVYHQDQGSIITYNTRVNRQKCYPIPYLANTGKSYIVTSGTIRLLRSGSAGTVEGTLTIKLHTEKDGMLIPDDPSSSIAQAVIDKTEYSSQYAAGTEFEASFAFDKPVPLNSNKAYYISIQGSNEDVTGSTTRFPLKPYVADVPAGRSSWQTTDDSDRDNQNAWVKADEGNYSPGFKLYGVEFRDFPEGVGIPDENGLEASFAHAKWTDFGGLRQMPEFSRMDLIFEVDGIEDTDGTLGKAPGSLLVAYNNIAELLLHYFNGRDWVKGNFNRERFSDTHEMYTNNYHAYFREISGRTYGEASNLDALYDMARNTYSALTFDAFGGKAGYSVYAYGRPQEPIKVLSDNNARFSQYYHNSLDTVVNTVSFNYARRLDSIHFQSGNDQTEFKEYSKTIDLTPFDGDIGETLGKKSFFLYGERRAKLNDYDYVKDEKSMLSVAMLYLSLHDNPYELISAIVDLQENKTLKMYDTLIVQSTKLPSILGTVPSFEDHEEICGLDGASFQAQDYRAQIIGMRLLDEKNSSSQILLTLRLLTHENDPTFKYSPIGI